MSKTIDINVGDTVKVIKPTKCTIKGDQTEYIPIGTICKVNEVEYDEDIDEVFVTISPIGKEYYFLNDEYIYCRDEVEKGRLEWIKDE